MVEIIPAIMPTSYDDLKDKSDRVSGAVSCAQIDIMDGVFVPSISWPYDKIGPSLESMVEKNSMLPLWEDIDYEIDLMVKDPEKVIEDWISVGARRVIVHFESVSNFEKIFEILKKRQSQEEDFVGITPVELGVALQIDTPLEKIESFIHDVDLVQLMGIKKIGYQGQKFSGETISRVKQLREDHPQLIISVDGGVSIETAPQLIKAGASRLVSGSTIFESRDIRETIFKLKQT